MFGVFATVMKGMLISAAELTDTLLWGNQIRTTNREQAKIHASQWNLRRLGQKFQFAVQCCGILHPKSISHVFPL